MKLKYRILWIENDEDWVESIEDQIQDYLDDLGFTYEKTLIGKEEIGIDYNMFDLVLMDLNLAEQPNGAELISKIRNLGVYTDVVFYSADGVNKLKTKSGENGLEGVYFSDRIPNTSFIKKVRIVIDSTLKKTQDLSNLRGLVMAEVSELDGKMRDIIRKRYVLDETEQLKSAFYEHIVNKQEDRIKKDLLKCDWGQSCVHKWKQMQISDIIPQMESAQLAKAINYILKPEQYTPSHANFFEDYLADIVNTRNVLAHCVSKIVDDKEILITRTGDRSFGDEDMKVIRKNIMKYSNLFNSILQE